MAKCLGLTAAELRIANVTRQHNGSDCGLYAIEFVRLYFEVCEDTLDFPRLFCLLRSLLLFTRHLTEIFCWGNLLEK